MSLSIKKARSPYRSNRSQGDPGLFGAIGKALSFGVRTAIGATGFGGAIGAIEGSLSGGPGKKGRLTAFPAVGPPEAPIPGVRGAIERFLPGGRTGYETCGKGERLNKTSYFLSDGTHVPAGSKCVKIRQRNPMNPRALSRAIGRIDAGKRFQNRMSSISTGKYTASGKRKDCPANGRNGR